MRLLNSFSCIMVFILIGSCNKKLDQIKNIEPTPSNELSVLNNSSYIDPEILLIMYNDYINKGDSLNAQNLQKQYDLKSGNNILYSSARIIGPVGDVVDGQWLHYNSTNPRYKYVISNKPTQINYGWNYFNWNDMASIDAYSIGTPITFYGKPTEPVQPNHVSTMIGFNLPYLNYQHPTLGLSSQVIYYKFDIKRQKGLTNNEWIYDNISGVDIYGGVLGIKLRTNVNSISFPNCLCLYTVKTFYRLGGTMGNNVNWTSWTPEGTVVEKGNGNAFGALQIVSYVVK